MTLFEFKKQIAQRLSIVDAILASKQQTESLIEIPKKIINKKPGLKLYMVDNE